MRQQRIELAPRSPSFTAAVLLHAHLVLAAPEVGYAKVERTSAGKVRRPSNPGSKDSVHSSVPHHCECEKTFLERER